MSWDYDSQANCGGSGPASHAPKASACAKGPRCPPAQHRLPDLHEELLVAVASVKLAFEAAVAPAVQVVDYPAAPVTSPFGAFFRGLVF
ncbi:uncharacterized protein Aud_000535 [Aspergillus udagawae]|uniref:Uncharacterized protein n=1 Tax=Aspergillus udagawae TaxID=91492 RepID=A0A8E0QLC4_9EURO|nr:uncharacterized protein Aud_000535 [Aspergillus udagawae]GIC84713.1 hypothetical protein Aud_000535 [Aspergillus udagawae]